MLKRCQILLENWQVEYIKLVCQKYDQSFSEVVRIIICDGLLCLLPLISPEYKSGIDLKLLAKMTKEAGDPTISEEEKHKLISRLYFETRKLTEHRMVTLRKELKKERKTK
jgi:hypothetical protein